jgi:hypothetical protein
VSFPRPTRSILALLFATALVLTGCDSSLTETDSGKEALPQQSSKAPGGTSSPGPSKKVPPTIDNQFANLAAGQVPGFGGFFLDKEGHPTIYLKNPGSNKSSALQALKSAPASEHSAVAKLQSFLASSDAQVLEGEFGFAQLQK